MRSGYLSRSRLVAQSAFGIGSLPGGPPGPKLARLPSAIPAAIPSFVSINSGPLFRCPPARPRPKTARRKSDHGRTRTSSFRHRLRCCESPFHQHLLRRGPTDGIPAAPNVNSREREPDSVLLEGPLNQRQSASADHELLVRLGHHLEPKLDRVVAKLLDALHLQRLD